MRTNKWFEKKNKLKINIMTVNKQKCQIIGYNDVIPN